MIYFATIKLDSKPITSTIYISAESIGQATSIMQSQAKREELYQSKGTYIVQSVELLTDKEVIALLNCPF